MTAKLEKLHKIIDVECEYLGQLQTLVRDKREKMVKENSQKIDQVLQKRMQNVMEAATTNTLAAFIS